MTPNQLAAVVDAAERYRRECTWLHSQITKFKNPDAAAAAVREVTRAARWVSLHAMSHEDWNRQATSEGQVM